MSSADRDRFVGCLLGGAVGDALGAPFEGLWSESIPLDLLSNFGEFEGYPPGQYTDDTQLTLATVEAILEHGVDVQSIAASIAALWANDSVIGPGGACTRAAHAFLRTGDWRSSGAPVGQAGNGTAMRIAPLGLLFPENPDELPSVVADVSRVTHQDPRSIAGGVAIAKATQLLAAGRPSTNELCTGISEAMAPFDAAFAGLVAGLPPVLGLPEADALERIAWAGQKQPELDRPIITPFVIPTVLASLFAVLTHPDSCEAAVSHVIRLGGDVDTTGCIVGALMGAKLGYDSIPTHLAEAVQDSERIRVLGARLHARTSPGVQG